MFTLPPLPPKDYVLRDVNQNQRSAQEHTPFALPRITQSSLSKFCAPIHFQENEKLDIANAAVSVSPQLLERWTDEQRAFWVDSPGKNGFFLHDIFKKYTVRVVPSYDSRLKHNERPFYRSFKYELDCAEEARMKKLYDKTDREENEERAKMNKIEQDKITKIDTSMGIKSCKLDTPFWWEFDKKDKVEEEDVSKTISRPADQTIQEIVASIRWQEEPYLLQSASVDPCQRRLDMALIDMPFRHDCINWYYRNYPPPNLRFAKKRFA